MPEMILLDQEPDPATVKPDNIRIVFASYLPQPKYAAFTILIESLTEEALDGIRTQLEGFNAMEVCFQISDGSLGYKSSPTLVGDKCEDFIAEIEIALNNALIELLDKLGRGSQLYSRLNLAWARAYLTTL